MLCPPCQVAMPRDFTSVVTPYQANPPCYSDSVAMEASLFVCVGIFALQEVCRSVGFPFCYALEGWLARLSHSAVCTLLSEHICCSSGDQGTSPPSLTEHYVQLGLMGRVPVVLVTRSQDSAQNVAMLQSSPFFLVVCRCLVKWLWAKCCFRILHMKPWHYAIGEWCLFRSMELCHIWSC